MTREMGIIIIRMNYLYYKKAGIDLVMPIYCNDFVAMISAVIWEMVIVMQSLKCVECEKEIVW